MIIIGSGSRNWKDRKPIRKVMEQLIKEFPEFTYYHGKARGFDIISEYQLRLLHHTDIKAFPAEWDKHGYSAGPIRNQLMLDTALQNSLPHDILLVAMPLENSIGTYHMINIATGKINVRIYDPHGDLIHV